MGQIRWYYANEDAAVYTQTHAFPPMTGYRQYKFSDGVGEMWEQWPRYDAGIPPPNVEDISVDGTALAFLGKKEWGPVIWGDLPNCMFPIAFIDNVINIDAAIEVEQPSVEIIFDAVDSIAEQATINIDVAETRQVETACIDLFAAGDPTHQAVLHFDAELHQAGESAGFDLSASMQGSNPPMPPGSAEYAVIHLDAETGGGYWTLPPQLAEVVIEEKTTPEADAAEIEVSVFDTIDPPLFEEATIHIDAEETNLEFEDPDEEEPGIDCEDAMDIELGEVYEFEMPGFDIHYFRFPVEGGVQYHVKLLAWNAGMMSCTVQTGANCASVVDEFYLVTEGACNTFTKVGDTWGILFIDGGMMAPGEYSFIVDEGPCP